MRSLTYAHAIREAFAQLLRSDPRVFVIGQGLWSPWYVGSSMADLDKEFGRERIIDSPVCENATTGAAVGAAMGGLRPIVVHPRMDFMVLAMDPIINQAANWSYMFAGEVKVPVVFRPIINRGGEQAAQHSQALHAFFMHVPGLKVVMPSTAYDAKGLLIAAVNDDNPVMYIDDRCLYSGRGNVPEEMYEVPIGKGVIRRPGNDVTIVATSYMADQAVQAGTALEENGVDAEIIDLRTIKPWDKDLVFDSVRKTGRLVVADGAWEACGVAAEIVASTACTVLESLRAPVVRVCLPDAPAPMSAPLEKLYYPDSSTIVSAVEKSLAARSEGTRYRAPTADALA
jgi:pyruvate/2-oxoglutarate/acetoin dehydrogenase E1 component